MTDRVLANSQLKLNGNVDYESSTALPSRLNRKTGDDENSLVHGIVTSEGLFDGTIFTASDEIYIEPASRYSSSSDCHRLSFENDNRCGNKSDDLRHHHTIAYRSRDISVLPTQSCASEELFHRNDRNRSRNSNETGKNGYILAGGTMRPFYQHVNEGTDRAKPGFYPMDARKKDPMASSHNLELLDK
ncbi:disintegrin and metalloproteinase domain-containing protein 10-like [Vespula maculifrons]|uniref:Disintegrin and metalloproteinase domain-containing protein 10-like n=1 Tax=Vespula maculifrons TaxID=7453 RepID=A0ABD2CNT2_VESMC